MKITIGKEYKNTLFKGIETLSDIQSLTILGRSAMGFSTRVSDGIEYPVRKYPVALGHKYNPQLCFLSWNMVKWYLQRFNMQ